MTTPESLMDIILLPGILMVFGIAIFFGSIQAERNLGVKNKWQGSCFLPLGLAFFVAIRQIWPLWTDVAFQFVINDYNQRKLQIGFYVSLVLPIVLIVVFAILLKRKGTMRRSNY